MFFQISLVYYQDCGDSVLTVSVVLANSILLSGVILSIGLANCGSGYTSNYTKHGYYTYLLFCVNLCTNICSVD